MVEEVNANNATPPTITINNNGQGDGKLVVTEGKVGNLLDLITAVDYLGRTINVNIEGNYDLNVAGEYKITLVATDRLGNESRKDIVLTVEKAPVVPDQPDQPDQPTQPDQPEQPGQPDAPSDGNTGDDESNQDSNKPGIPDGSGSANNNENNGTNNSTDNNGTNNNTTSNNITNTDSEKKNELPKTGQGVFYGVIVAIAAAIIGSGIYLVTKKKKK